MTQASNDQWSTNEFCLFSTSPQEMTRPRHFFFHSVTQWEVVEEMLAQTHLKTLQSSSKEHFHLQGGDAGDKRHQPPLTYHTFISLVRLYPFTVTLTGQKFRKQTKEQEDHYKTMKQFSIFQLYHENDAVRWWSLYAHKHWQSLKMNYLPFKNVSFLFLL